MPSSTVVSLVERLHERPINDRSDPVARFAFDMCERTFMRRDWNGFDYWFRVARSHRRPSASSAFDSCGVTGLRL
jgi:hypothetical protein